MICGFTEIGDKQIVSDGCKRSISQDALTQRVNRNVNTLLITLDYK